MVRNRKPRNFNCPFCRKELESRFSKCFNIYCRGQKFNLGNLVLFRLNPDLGLGKIIKIKVVETGAIAPDHIEYKLGIKHRGFLHSQFILEKIEDFIELKHV